MIEHFNDLSPFVTEDNRRFRPRYTTTAALLNTKHDALLPASVVKGARVLDLGSCTGATGYWVARQGAAAYLGVEHQDGYVELSRRLLADEPICRIEQGTADQHFARSTDKHDIVCLLGVVHGVFDPLSMIREAARRAEHFVCFDDMGWQSESPVMTVDASTKMPLAGEKAATVGFGWLFSPSAIQMIMGFLGFIPDAPVVFNGSRRWLCRYRRIGVEGQESSFAQQTEAWVTPT